VHVSGALEQLGDLHSRVASLGPGASLADKTGQAREAVTANDVSAACSILSAFISQVKAQSGKSVTTAMATSLITDATRIRAVLGC
jgi:hypothetical protein